MPRAKTGSFSFERFVRKDLRDMEPYAPIAFPGSLPGDGKAANGELIKLDGNENVYGCSARVQRALADYRGYHIYPDAEQRELREALAGYTGLSAAQILAGSGSDELIELLLRLTLDPGDCIINCPPTFGMYEVNAKFCGGEAVAVPRESSYELNVPGILKAIGPTTKAIIIANPNNPTGTLTPRKEIEALLETGLAVLVDEAYYEFCGETVADLLPTRGNLIVLRTFSKWAGLAGLRIGYGLMSPELVQRLMAVKPPYNINAAANLAALESLKDVEYLQGTVKALVKEREHLAQRLLELEYLQPIPSAANFILCRVLGRDAKQLWRELRTKGIYIRHFKELPEFIRISVGKPEQSELLIQALRR